MEKLYIYLVVLLFILIFIYYLYNIMNNMPIYAIAVFNDTIKGTVKLRENLNDNVVIIDLNFWLNVSRRKHFPCTCR